MKNTPKLWQKTLPTASSQQNKYDRGHLVVSGGSVDCTGAACLAATAGLRAGAGLVTIAAPAAALTVYASKLNSVMVKPFRNIDEFKKLIEDERINAMVIGPGNGVGELTIEKTKAALALGKKCVIDADAITSFEGRADELFKAIKSDVVLTPHEGEFKRLFDFDGNREEMAVQAAKLSNAVIVLKGHETIIAAPDGKSIINQNAPATLATAGSGDVLAGIIGGLLAQSMPVFDAAACAVWLHGEAAKLAGTGMISEDLPGLLPQVLKELDVKKSGS